ncbi:uncharacterized protein DUF2384 [Rathayibacter sp. PhB151]|uniref:antitoxin Xre/MbcA/ParS toxin-binding domain-containing protein n=1 Tax=Rathayibacter sp. PhB151 TaxID=2485189 RepID=UPI00106348D5|nr:antitoxin Xre/MbcA/ParS toxin-binding domain-containing protein [Rathayibacter sp. PhB151]TDX81552.1 uncharacterized protein DUF2384 [Rathayibacter sp. PhB151]
MVTSSSKAVRSRRSTADSRTAAAGKALAVTQAGRTVGGAGAFELGARAATIADAVGGQTVLAKMLEVNKSQPSQWIKGLERPNPVNARAIVELDYVIARVKLLWAPSMVAPWLTGQNAFLDGARPIDVLRLEGSQRVIEALDAEASGVFA